MSTEAETSKTRPAIMPGEKRETSLIDLLINDLTIDREIIKTFQGNVTALKGWLPGIGEIRTRETYRLFLDDAKTVLGAMTRQRVLMLKTLHQMRKEWKLQQQSASASNVTGTKLTLSPKPDSSVPGATEPEKNLPPS